MTPTSPPAEDSPAAEPPPTAGQDPGPSPSPVAGAGAEADGGREVPVPQPRHHGAEDALAERLARIEALLIGRFPTEPTTTPPAGPEAERAGYPAAVGTTGPTAEPADPRPAGTAGTAAQPPTRAEPADSTGPTTTPADPRPAGSAPVAVGAAESADQRPAGAAAQPAVGVGGTGGGASAAVVPAWRRVTRAETRWASTGSVVAVVLVQFLWLPGRLAVHPKGLMPAVELALLLALIAGNPHRIERGSRTYRALGLALALVIGGANAYGAVRLVAGLVRGTDHSAAGPLLLTGGAIWLINIVIFALLYWELDRGGPAARAQGERDVPDFLFVQMQAPELAPPRWEPVFFDYFYLSFTNSTAFSPTDVMPVTRAAKVLMLAQSAVSLMTVVLVVAKAVNALG